MHPILLQKGRLGLYLAAWIPIAALIAALVNLSGGAPWSEALALAFPMAAQYAFLCLAAWYLCRIFPLPGTGIVQLFGIYAVAAFFSSCLWILIGKGWVLVLSQVPFFAAVERRYAGEIPLLFGIGILLFFLAVAVHYLMITFETARESERRTLELKILAREAELKALKAQIDPHFLFNSLNSVSALITTDQVGARKMCLLLADFLRKSLNLAAQGKIPLEEEIALGAKFLAIEQVRFSSRLKAEQEIEEESKSCLVPPLLLQPLIENAIKHGIAHLLEGGTVEIRAKRHGERLKITVENPCDPERPAGRGRGLGLENVRHRLTTLYGSEARIDVLENARHFRVELSLPALTDPKPHRGPHDKTVVHKEFQRGLPG